MPLDPLSIGLLGGNILGGLFSGLSQGNAARQQVGESRRQFNQQQAPDLIAQLENSPARDRVMAALMARIGGAGGRYQPADIYNPTMAPQMGFDQDAFGQALANYVPGSGGQMAGDQLRRELLGGLVPRESWGSIPGAPPGAGMSAGGPYDSRGRRHLTLEDVMRGRR